MSTSTNLNGGVRKWKRYPGYRDSNVPWLKQIPSHWKAVRLKFLASFCGGGTPSKDNVDFWKGEIPWVSPKDMKTEFIEDTEDHISEAAIAGSSTRLISAGVVLVVVRSGILRHSIPVAVTTRQMALNQDMRAIMPNEALCPDYLASVIRGHNRELLTEWCKQGATVESVEVEYLVNTSFPVPPLDDQRHIITFLDRETAKIDALIAKKERLIELLQEKRTALISHAVTKGIDPSVPMKDSGVEWLRKIPAHWGIIQSRRVFKVRNEPAWDSDEQLTASQKYGMLPQTEFMEIEGRRVVVTIKGVESLRHVEPNDFVISLRSFQGGIEWCKVRGSVTFHYVVLKPVKTIHPAYFGHLFKSSVFIQALRATTDFIRDGQDLRYSHFISVPLPMVPMDEQAAIVEFLDKETAKLDSLINVAQKTINLLREYRTALISAAVIGKIDVREEVA